MEEEVKEAACRSVDLHGGGEGQGGHQQVSISDLGAELGGHDGGGGQGGRLQVSRS